MPSLTIPEYCGAMLLTDTVLFPHGALPLHIFEDRYRQLLDDSLQGSCLFCIANLSSKETKQPANCVSPIGTVGLIRASHELDDGRSHLILHGVYRVRFLSWQSEKPYPVAHIIPHTSEPIPPNEAPRKVARLRDLVNETLSSLPTDIRFQINDMLDRASDEPSVLADAVAQQFVQDTSLRYQLLESPSVSERFDILFSYLPLIQATNME